MKTAIPVKTPLWNTPATGGSEGGGQQQGVVKGEEYHGDGEDEPRPSKVVRQRISHVSSARRLAALPAIRAKVTVRSNRLSRLGVRRGVEGNES